MNSIAAWKIAVTPEDYAILPRQSIGHLLDAFKIERVPLAPHYVKHVFYWKGQVIPVLNLTTFNQDNLDDIEHKEKYEDLISREAMSNKTLMGIVTYNYDNRLLQGGIIMYSSPELVDVGNELCDLPVANIPWSYFASSCVEVEKQKLPIISVDLSFSNMNTQQIIGMELS